MNPRPPKELERAFHAYIAAVHDGTRVCGRREQQAVERHERLVVEGPSRGLRWNFRRGLRACWWIEHHCCFSKGDKGGQPFILEPWEAFVVCSIAGWEIDVEHEWLRAIREVYMTMGRGNAKSELFAAIALCLLCTGLGSLNRATKRAMPQIGAELYSAATTKDQAAIPWKSAYWMARKSPKLRRILDLPRKPTAGGRYTLSYPETGGSFRAVAADSDTLDGLSPLMALVDEVHAHKTGGTWDVLGSGLKKNKESLRVAITTRGKNRNSLCGEIEDDAIRVLDGVYEDDSKFVFICELDPDDDPWVERFWPKPNPNIGVSVHLAGLREDAKTASRNAARRTEFLQKRMNRWTAGDEAWMPDGRWLLGSRGLGDSIEGVNVDALRGRPVYLGLDIGSVRDTTSLVAVWPLDDGTFAVHPWTFVPDGTIQDHEIRGPRERELLLRWKAAGLVTATPGDMLDHEAVWGEILNCMDRYSIQELAMDQTQASMLIGRCESVGINVVIHNQGYAAMTPAIKTAEVMIGSKLTPSRLRHGGHEVLRWMISNANLKRGSAGGLMIEKADDKRRVDGVIGFLMALNRASSAAPQGTGIHAGPDDEDDSESVEQGESPEQAVA